MQYVLIILQVIVYQIFPILMIQMFFSQIQQATGPNFRKVGKSLADSNQPAHLPSLVSIWWAIYELPIQV